MIRLAIVGTGSAARHHVAAAKAIPGLQVAAVAGRNPATTHEFIRDMCPGCCALSLSEVLTSPKIDAVIIALPAVAQPDIAVAAFESGKHVLCEKPLAPTLAGAESIEAAWKASGRVGMVNFCFRLIPEIERFRQQLIAGICGSLALIQVEWILSSRLDPALPYNWKADVDSGGGVLQNFGSHVLDYLFYDRRDVRVLAASQKTVVESRVAGSGEMQSVSGDEIATVLFDLPGLCPVFVHLSLVTRPPIGHRLLARGSKGTLLAYNTSRRSPGGPFRLTFSEAAEVQLSDGSPDFADADGDGLELSALFERVLARFSDAIRTGSGTYVPDISSGVQVTRTIQTIQTVSRNAGAS
jgi:hypothetical protein